EADFTDSLERIVLGAERKVMLSPSDKRRTAYHEGGHAIVGMLTEGADPVRKISIIPRGLALGVTFAAPDADRFNYSEMALRENRDKLDALAEALLEHETLDQLDAYAAAGIGPSVRAEEPVPG